MMDDFISRASAIELASGACHPANIAEGLRKLPSAQPNLQPTCNQLATDTISRQAAIDALFGMTAYKNTVPVFSAVFNIEKIPAAPVREVKRGQWIQDSYGAMDDGEYLITRCSYCGEANPVSNYCPNCGAKMGGQQYEIN